MNKKKYEMIFCIVNAGIALTVMEAAKKAGARGGTILRARTPAWPPRARASPSRFRYPMP